MGRRYSFGGSVVVDSLQAVGFRVNTPGVELVETAGPKRRPADAVLAQSLWNVLPSREFKAALRPYPKSMQTRSLARRELARVNLRRAKKVVCLTNSMAESVQLFTGRDVEVAPVCLPADAISTPRRALKSPGDGTALVPGTVTWYKRPDAALDWLTRRADPNVARVCLAGEDDGSGCLEYTALLAERLGFELIHHPLGRREMWNAILDAAVILLPSSLESLGFSLSEALWRGRKVVASSIPAHIEVAQRVGVAPTWISGAVSINPASGTIEPDDIVEQWGRVGEALGLEPNA